MTGVQDHEIGRFGIGRGRHAFCGKQFRHALAVIDVHLTAEGFDEIVLRFFWGFGHAAGAIACTGGRSEEHTSELQSLMRISYAVFCLKKKKKDMKRYYKHNQ